MLQQKLKDASNQNSHTEQGQVVSVLQIAKLGRTVQSTLQLVACMLAFEQARLRRVAQFVDQTGEPQHKRQRPMQALCDPALAPAHQQSLQLQTRQGSG